MSSWYESYWAFGVVLSDEGKFDGVQVLEELFPPLGGTVYPGYRMEQIGDPYARVRRFILIPDGGFGVYDPKDMIAFASDDVRSDVERVAGEIAERYGFVVLPAAWQDYQVYA